MYFRTKKTGPYEYVQVVASYRDDGKVRQQVLVTLGRLDALKSSGQLDQLMRSGLRFCERLVVLDAQARGDTQAAEVRRIGPDLVFGRLWEELGFHGILKGLLKERRYTRFLRSFTLPTSVNEQGITAKLEEGILHITLDKRPETKPRKVTVA